MDYKDREIEKRASNAVSKEELANALKRVSDIVYKNARVPEDAIAANIVLLGVQELQRGIKEWCEEYCPIAGTDFCDPDPTACPLGGLDDRSRD